MTEPGETRPATMQIFRARDGKSLEEAGCMTVEPFSPAQLAGVAKVQAGGPLGGDEARVLCNIPGFSLTHVWFKKDYPLPLHSHDTDCMYYIIAGSLRLGTEELGPRDSFLVPGGVPYTYKPGPEGVELLEIRHGGSFNFVNLAKGAAFWDKAAEIADANREAWKTAPRPVLNA